MQPIRELADEIIDTSDMTVHELRQFFMTPVARSGAGEARDGRFVRFGYKYGLPSDADLVFDVRCLPNPYFVPGLRRRTGRDRAVAAFMERDVSTRGFMDRLEEYVKFVVPYYIARKELSDGAIAARDAAPLETRRYRLKRAAISLNETVR